MEIIDKLSESGVVYFDLNEDKSILTATEACDLYFSVDLSKKQVKKLIEELTLLYNQMKQKKR